MRAALLALLCAGCAAPAEYRQGVPIRPPAAPPARPGVGAPVVGQPGFLGQPLPRSRNRRVLPPSTEPSIYASEAPRGAEGPPGWHNRPPIVLSVELPLESPPSSDGELIIYLENVRACAVIAHTALTTLMPEEEIGRLKANEVRCLAAALWSLCAVKDMARLDWASERMEIQGFMRRAYERNVADAERFQKEACKGRTWTPRLFEWASRASLRWDTFDWRAPTPREG